VYDPDKKQVDFQVTEDDYVDFVQYYFQHTPRGRHATRRMYLFGGILFLAFAYLEYDHPKFGAHNPAYYALYLVISAAILGAVYSFFLWYIRPTFARWSVRAGPRKRILDPTTLRIADDALIVANDDGEGRLPWDSVQRVAENESADYILLGGLSAFVIPHDAFGDRAERVEFLNEIRERSHAA